MFDFENTPIRKDTNLIAQWGGDCAGFSVEFDLDGGTASEPIPTQFVPAGKTATRPTTTPSKDGCGFIGWYEKTAEDPDPQPEPGAGGTINVMFRTDGGTPQPAGQEIVSGTMAQYPGAVEKEGCEFLGWYLAGEMPDELVSYLVTFDTDGGNDIMPVSVWAGKPVAKPADPVKEGEEFKEWQLDGKPYDFSKPVEGNITLVAAYKGEAYAVLYTPDSSLSEDTVEDASSIRAVLSGNGNYWPNYSKHTHIKFTEMCQELTDIKAIGNNVQLVGEVTTVEGLENFTAVESIGNNFLTNTRISSSLTTITNLPPNLTSIGNNFLSGCTQFIDAPTLSEKITSIGTGFMYNCKNFTGPLVVDCTAHPTDDESLSTDDNTAEMYVKGITLEGEGVESWEELENRDETPFRKLHFVSGPSGDGSLADFKKAVETNEPEKWYPIGTEIGDVYAGNPNPLIVAQYLNSSNNSAYNGAEGAILVRKYVDTQLQYKNGGGPNYINSDAKSFLDNTYINNCSSELRSIISNITIPYYNGSSMVDAKGKWFLMSAYEVCNQGANGDKGYEGVMWDYWKQRTGLANPDVLFTNNNGRIMTDRGGTNQIFWLRSWYSAAMVCSVNTAGTVGDSNPVNSRGILPACFVSNKKPLEPTLANLKQALEDGDTDSFPIGTELDDTYNGNNNPLIVAHYLDGSSSVYKDADGNNAEGVILVRKYVDPTSQVFGSTPDYSTSTIKNFLDTTYLDNCSDTIKSIISEITVPSYNSTARSKFFLMSDTEVCATGFDNVVEGIMWDYWKQKTGLSTPNNNANSGRIMRDRNGTAQLAWLRSRYGSNSEVCFITADGIIFDGVLSYGRGVIPACFVSSKPQPTLANLKKAVDKGDTSSFPVGTEIPDTWDGNDNPLIVAQYLDRTNNQYYGGAEGVFLIRKYCEPSSQFNATASVDYATSTAKTLLDGTYLNGCSPELKNTISDINIPYYNGSSITSVPSKWFLMSAYEVCGAGYVGATGYEGIMWQYWKNQTGLSSPNNSANNGRIIKTRASVAPSVYLRSRGSSSVVCDISSGGNVNTSSPADSRYIYPACFIAKSGGGDLPDSIDISKPLDKDTLDDIQKVIDAGKAEDYFSLGDQLLVSYGSYTMPFEIVGFEDVEVEGGEKKKAINLLAGYTSETTITWGMQDYSSSNLRNHIMVQYRSKLNSDFINCLANTKVSTLTSGGGTDIIYDELFAPSMAQLGVVNNIYNSAQQSIVEGPTFSAYVGADSGKRVRHKVDATSTAQSYWTRTFCSDTLTDKGRILTTGEPARYSPLSSREVVAACNLIGKN